MRIFSYQPPAGLPPVIYQDDYYIAINKPSGLLSNPGRAPHTHDCALTRLQAAFKEIYLIHRLDCDTSGVLIFAKQKKAEGALKKQLQERKVQKTYNALVWGVPKNKNGTVDLALAANPDDIPLQKACTQGKEAITHYTVLESNTEQNIALLELRPLTGRTHQLRVHLDAIDHPILGDPFYGHNAAKSQKDRLCLHATTLCFNHPFTQKKITIETPTSF